MTTNISDAISNTTSNNIQEQNTKTKYQSSEVSSFDKIFDNVFKHSQTFSNSNVNDSVIKNNNDVSNKKRFEPSGGNSRKNPAHNIDKSDKNEGRIANKQHRKTDEVKTDKNKAQDKTETEENISQKANDSTETSSAVPVDNIDNAIITSSPLEEVLPDENPVDTILPQNNQNVDITVETETSSDIGTVEADTVEKINSSSENIDSSIKQKIEDICDDETSESDNQAEIDSNTILADDEIVTEEEATIPKIKVNEEIQSNISKISEKQTDEKNEKILLDQTILDDLDAEITSVSSNKTDSGFLGQGNAAEQIIKFSIEPTLADSDTQSDFSNLLNQKSAISSDVKSQINIQTANPANDVPKTNIMNQINEKLHSFKSFGTEKVEIILKPENLGTVNVQIQNSKGVITATLIAQTPEVKETLEKNIEILKNNLNSQGVNVSNLVVKIDEADKSAFNNLNFSQDQFGNNFNQQQQQQYKSEFNNINDNTNLGNSEILQGEDDISVESSVSSHNGMVDYKI